MAKTAFLASSLLLLQSLTVVLSGSVIPRDDDDAEKGFPRVPEDPEIPPRACDPDCKDAAYNLPENFYPYRNDIFTILFGRPGALESNPTAPPSEILTKELTETLPYLIHQFGNVDDVKIPALVKEGVPLLVKDVLGLVGGQDDPNGAKITQWARKIAPKAICQFYAVAALPATEAASDTIYYANQNQAGKPTTPDQDYFLQPVYGPLAHRDDITIKYNAKFPALFGTAAAAFVQDRTTYVRAPEFSQYRKTPTAPGNPKFKDQIRTLLYQFKHTQQWSQTTPQDYFDNAYYLDYHYEYCLADFHHAQNQVEKFAARDSKLVTDALLDHPIGGQFFEVWTARQLSPQLGFPTTTEFSPQEPSCVQTKTYSLKFDKGALEIKKCGACSRLVKADGGKEAWVGKGC